jgi:GTP-binding protein
MRPIAAIVGRPNVGKSTLFNRIAGERISIVDDAPGVTRDRVYADCDWRGRDFTLVDTGGLDPAAEDIIGRQVYEQAEIAIETASVIIFLTDIKTGVTAADAAVAEVLRRSGKPVVLAVNKADDIKNAEADAYEFYSLGLGDPIAVSAGQALCIGDLLDAVFAHFDDAAEAPEEGDLIRVAVVGKPNAGKSSLINKILGQERLLVSDIPGTTRDAVDTFIKRGGRTYSFIDTAGMRKKSRIKENIEHYAVLRAIAAVERADVCVIMISAEDGVGEQDTKIAGIAHNRGKASIIAVNKWDKVEKDSKTMDAFSKEINGDLSYMPYAPKVFISALTGQRVHKIFDYIDAVWENSAMRVSTGVLNDALIEATATTPPPARRGKALKIYYASQVGVKPPTFVLFVNDAELLHYSYKRFLENQIRENFGFAGVPITLIARNRKD